ncbi:hypothetical protein Moror_5461 [Moniliophthora roreri MCA 2997]|uniref:Uncharacterized protein n=1 Tax=Moniliophthora roreri (strain MCA 2997) TaxID=1381753 RepID=V2XQC6_MONRO|nr:hypothetical protein Moror_5461 [Moniliophthora roreri MCA 2997]
MPDPQSIFANIVESANVHPSEFAVLREYQYQLAIIDAHFKIVNVTGIKNKAPSRYYYPILERIQFLPEDTESELIDPICTYYEKLILPDNLPTMKHIGTDNDADTQWLLYIHYSYNLILCHKQPENKPTPQNVIS